VVTTDRVDALADAIIIARRSRRIALEAVVVGMALSLVGMAAAAIGLLPPAAGALAQEAIDVAAIALALRALLPSRAHTVVLPPEDVVTARRLYAEHHAVRPIVEQVRTVADALAPGDNLGAAHALLDKLESDLLAHERAEEAELLPIVARALGGPESVGAISRTHAEIEHQIARLRHLLDDIGASADAEDVVELRGLLYGLYAILRLHNAQEEEYAFSLMPTAAAR
jgi:hypothetical protein